MAKKSYEERLREAENPLLKKLFSIIIEKKSNLCVAVDFNTLKETLNFIDRCAKHVCIIKTHCERYEDADVEEALSKIYAKKKEYNFLLFEDRKFHDESNQVLHMYKNSYMKYADIVTIYPDNDDSLKAIELALKDADLPADEPRGCLAICQLSFASISNPQAYLECAARHPGVCLGIIAQDVQVPDSSQMIKATPGIHLTSNDGGMGQKWKSPSDAIGQGADIVIVGRGITAAPEDKLEKICCQYKEVAYNAYLNKA